MDKSSLGARCVRALNLCDDQLEGCGGRFLAGVSSACLPVSSLDF